MSEAIPEPDEDRVVVLARGLAFSGWTSVQIETSLTDCASTFKLGIAGVYATHAGQIVEGDAVQILIGQDEVITGVAERVRRGGDATGMTVQISGRSRTRNVVDCSAPIISLQGQKLSKLAAKLLENYGIPVVDEAGVGDQVVRSFHAEEGETLHDALDRLSQDLHYLITDDGKGRLVFTLAGKAGSAADAIVRGAGPFLQGEVDRTVDERFSIYTCKGQSFTDLEVSADVQGGAVDVGISEFRELIIKPERGVTPKGAAARAAWEAATRAAKALTYTCVLTGWRQSTGALWAKNLLAPVRDAYCALLDVELLIVAVTFTLDEQGRKVGFTMQPREAFTPPPSKGVDVTDYGTLALESTDPEAESDGIDADGDTEAE